MIRHRCAICGAPINRTDRLFEDSDGTLCAACLALPATADPARTEHAAGPLPAWALLPELARPMAPAWPFPGHG